MANADFVNQVYQTALQLGIPEVQARLAASQAALETNYGKSAPGNNYFGIKGKGQTLATKEASNGALTAINDSFRTYPDLAGSVQGWWDQIQRNWPEAASATNFGTAIDALNNGRHGRYATDAVEANDPLTYQDKLASINQRFLGGTPLPPANIPSVGTQLDTSPSGSYKVRSGDTLGKIAQAYGTTVQQLAQANGITDPNKIRAGATLKIGAPPPLPPSTFGGRLPAQAQYGVDRLTPGKVTLPPTDFATETGAPDLRMLGMTLPQGILGAAGRAGAGIGASGGSSLVGMPPLPIPRPVGAPPAPVQAQPPQLPAQRPSAPVAPPMQTVLTASGDRVAVGIHDQGDHSVMVSDDGTGHAKIERIRGPMSIPGVIDPLREANANTIAGGMIRKMLPGQLAGSASGFVPAVTDNVKSAAVGAAQNLGNSIGGMFGGLGSMFAPKPPSVPTFAQLQAIRAVPANSYYRPAPMPMSRPLSFFAQPVPQALPVPVARSAAPSQSNGGGYANGKQNAINDTLRTLGFNV